MKSIIRSFSLLVILLAACTSPTETGLTETSIPTTTSTPFPTATSTVTITPSLTPVLAFHLGMEGITSMTDCNQLSLTSLDTQMPRLVAQELAAYESNTSLKPFGIDSGSGITGGTNEPWDIALISQRIPSDLTL